MNAITPSKKASGQYKRLTCSSCIDSFILPVSVCGSEAEALCPACENDQVSPAEIEQRRFYVASCGRMAEG